MRQFHAFRDERPKEEKWELIDGVPMMMPPPTLMHQRIARNLETLLNAHLQATKPEWQADREVGVWLKGDEKYNPEPDVIVIETAFALGRDLRRALLFRGGDPFRKRPQRRCWRRSSPTTSSTRTTARCCSSARTASRRPARPARRPLAQPAPARRRPRRSPSAPSARSAASAISTSSPRSIHSRLR